MMKNKVFVIGHKNADTDSICSAIAYAYLKQQIGVDAIASRISQCNSETKYVLDTFGFEEPLYIHSAKCTLRDISIDDAYLVNKDFTMKEALDCIVKRKNKGVFVVDEYNRLEGIVSISDLTSLWTMDEINLTMLMSKVKLNNIIKTLYAECIYCIDDFKTNGKVHLMMSLANNSKIDATSIVIVGNSPEVQRYVIDCGVSMIIICGENWIDNVTLEKAKEKNVVILHTPLSALACSQLVYQSSSIEEIMSDEVLCFLQSETMDEISNRIAKTRYRSYPVLNDNNEVVGAMSRFHLFNYPKKQFILVDHNEAHQSINDLEHGEVIEIVDHHRLGGIETVHPISITCKSVGCTCTIIGQLFDLHQIEIPQNIAGIMLAAIVSDTLNCKSPTTTSEDIAMADRLSEIAQISRQQLHSDMVGNTDSIVNKSYVDLLYEDFKEFRINGSRIAVGQVACRSKDDFYQIEEGFLPYLEEVAHTQHYDLIVMMFTDPRGSGSQFMYTGKKSWVIKEGFKDVLVNNFGPSIISRKKQVLPMLINLFNK